ncbi:tRNA-binding protein [Mesonia hippocampi]|uniref:tRNA-binding protein n=1 Tax=Mesonia hippocampi TaxID=1628250 RepID=A0A840ENU6_9FLAO|nr:tRNA-binding protein [Mesonia hippocampi]MBB4120049.1 tRNA-binding protein [Mesonia hippocampi]
MKISWSDFEKIEMRVGTIIEVNDFPEARNPSYQLKIDFGAELGVKKTSAQITKRYKKEDLLGKQTIAVVNFPKKQIANFMSECLLLGAVNADEVTIIQPEAKVPNGLRVS